MQPAGTSLSPLQLQAFAFGVGSFFLRKQEGSPPTDFINFFEYIKSTTNWKGKFKN
jgi:hypothetical protein